MYRDNLELATHDTHNFVLNQGALGDVICSLPAIVQARRARSAAMKMKVWVPPQQMLLVEHLLKPYGTFEVLDFTTFPSKAVDRQAIPGFGAVSLNQMAFNTHTRNRVHMVDYAFGCLTDSRPESMAERSYPTAAPLGGATPLGNYVVVPTGATSDNKLFRASVMTPVLEWLLANGYQPVLVGTKVTATYAIANGVKEKLVIREQADMVPAAVLAACADMREKTTLLELRDLLGYACAVVGVDGGTLHLAGTTDVPIVYAMGTTLPKHRYIPRDGNHNHKIRYVIPRNLECTGCQSNITMTSWDFRNCFYGDSFCMERLHPEDFINGLKELGL